MNFRYPIETGRAAQWISEGMIALFTQNIDTLFENKVSMMYVHKRIGKTSFYRDIRHVRKRRREKKSIEFHLHASFQMRCVNAFFSSLREEKCNSIETESV